MLQVHFSSRAVALGLSIALATASCSSAREDDPAPRIGRVRSGLTQTIVYVGKQSITDFTGYGQHLQYWPLFGFTSGETARRTDDPACIELTPSFEAFKHHYLLPGRTFSNDGLGNPIGTKTRGGYPTWDTFKLPNGTVGRSGTFYDESNVDNSNNTVNEMKISSTTLSEFCLNLITDNTAGEHNANVQLEARSDKVDLGLAGNPDLSFDGKTDMYTFRYQGMKQGDIIKIRFQCSAVSGCKGAGLGGIMVSDISTCTPGDAGADAGAPEAGVPEAGLPEAGATPDAAAPPGEAPDAGGAGTDGEESKGCGCETVGRRGASSAWSLLLVVPSLAALYGRRRRAQRPKEEFPRRV